MIGGKKGSKGLKTRGILASRGEDRKGARDVLYEVPAPNSEIQLELAMYITTSIFP